MKIGDTLAGRFELRSALGGSGSSFVAWDLRSRREVVVRLFLDDSAQDSAERLDALLAAASCVKHPVVVLPGVHRSLVMAPLFVVGEKIPGEDFAALAIRGPVPWQRAFDIALACAEGLAALAAATGKAHRALKPGNVRIAANGEVRVLDFGVAEFGVHPVPPRDDGSFAEYRAPEQLEGSPGDGASDVFTLGVLLFELIAAVHPYSAPTSFKAAYKLLAQQSASKPSELAPGVVLPSQVEALILRALARQPAGRFKDAADMARQLVLVRRSPGLPQRTRGPAPRPSAVNEELTLPLAKPEYPDEMTTAVNASFMRSLQKALTAVPGPVPAEDDAKISAPAPVLAGSPLLKADPGRHRKEPTRACPPPPEALPRLETAPPPLAPDDATMELAERTTLMPKPAPVADVTLIFPIEDRVAHGRAEPSTARPKSVPEKTMELPPGTDNRSVQPNRPQMPAEAPTTVFTRQAAGSDFTPAPAQPNLPPSASDFTPAPAQPNSPPTAKLSGAPAGAQSLPRALFILNLVCLILVIVGVYGFLAS